MQKICIVTTVPETIYVFFKEHIRLISKYYNITIITNINKSNSFKFKKEINLISINIKRKVDLYNDIKSLIELKNIFDKEKFDLVLSITPKAGLLASLAGFFSGINTRIHWFTGQIWATQKGLKRIFLKYLDKLIVLGASHILVDSQSQYNFLKSEKILNSKKSSVLGHGSISGVDLKLFKFNIKFKKIFRKKINLNYSHKVILFLGRINRDKGIYDLIEAFELIEKNIKNLHLVIIGPDEENIKKSITRYKSLNNKIHFVDKTLEPHKWLCIGDVFCLPSYREGFGSSVIEAAAVGIPSITSRIYGLKDTVKNGQTGLTYKLGNINQLAASLQSLIINNDFRKKLGKNAKKRVSLLYKHTYLSQLLLNYIKKTLNKK